MKRKNRHDLCTRFRFPCAALAWAMGLVFWACTFSSVAAQVEPVFLYNLSNFAGPIPYTWANVSFDENRNEIYAVDSHRGDIRIFNDKGMEVYRFGDDGSLGPVVDVAVRQDGKILVLSKGGTTFSLLVCNYRGEPQTQLQFKDFPSEFSDFLPDQMALRNRQLYLLDTMSMRIAVTDDNGGFQHGYDLVSLLDLEEKKRGQAGVGGFSVDRHGNMLFTIPVLFAAYKLFPDGTVTGFGRAGSAPGSFGVVGGIVADDWGYYYVADRLKCTVLVFDENFKFQSEFGYRGPRPENLVGPRYLALDDKGRLYVSQLKNRGISVFKVAPN